MTEIKRFDMRGNTWPSDDGSIVSYKDHAAIVAALQEQVRALAAEVSECRCFVAKELGPESGIQFASLSKERNDEILREIRAQAVESFMSWSDSHIEEGDEYEQQLREVSSACKVFAAHIRAGGK